MEEFFTSYIERIVKDTVDKKISEIIETNKTKSADVYLTVDEVVKKFHVSKTTLWRWDKSNYISPKKIGSRKLYCEKELKNCLS